MTIFTIPIYNLHLYAHSAHHLKLMGFLGSFNFKVPSPKELAIITDLPMNLAEQRFARLQQLLKRDKFETSNMESIVLSQFKDWIDKHHAQP